jgi:hypothetical protein
MAWLMLAFIAPILVASSMGSTYTFAFGTSGVGLLFCLLNIFLIHAKKSSSLERGAAPTWVSVLGLLGVGLLLSGLIVALLLWVNVIKMLS